MYRPANFYAARSAAIKEALEDARCAAATKKPAKLPAPYCPEALRGCGEIVPVTLGVFFGDLAGTVVNATRCYYVTDWMYVATFTDDAGRLHVVQVSVYHKGDDIHDYAISEIAVSE